MIRAKIIPMIGRARLRWYIIRKWLWEIGEERKVLTSTSSNRKYYPAKQYEARLKVFQGPEERDIWGSTSFWNEWSPRSFDWFGVPSIVYILRHDVQHARTIYAVSMLNRGNYGAAKSEVIWCILFVSKMRHWKRWKYEHPNLISNSPYWEVKYRRNVWCLNRQCPLKKGFRGTKIEKKLIDGAKPWRNYLRR